MPKVNCPIPECTYETSDGEAAVIAAELNIHALTHRTPQSSTGAERLKPPRLDRPIISRESTEDEWSIFTKKWELFKRGSDIPDGQITTHLWQCCEPALETDLFRQIDDVAQVDEKTLLAAIKSLAVVNIAASVRKASLLSMRQDHGQPIRTFAAKVKGAAQICSFTKICPKAGCGQLVDYTEDIVKHVVISGLVDDDIRRDVLGQSDLDSKSLADTIKDIENKEMALRATAASIPQATQYSAGLASTTVSDTPDENLKAKLAVIIKCKTCGKNMNKFKYLKGRFRKTPTLKEFSRCIECWKSDKASQPHSVASPAADKMGSLSNSAQPPTSGKKINHHAFPRRNISIDHHIFDGTHGWMVKESKKQPTLALTISTMQADYDHLNISCPRIAPKTVSVIADTGAQSSLMGLRVFHSCGFTDNCLLPVKKRMFAANNEGINILGAVFARLSGKTRQRHIMETAEMIYITDSTDLFYLSRHAMEQLGIINKDFPQLGATTLKVDPISQESLHVDTPHRPCSCPKRGPPPPRPVKLPFVPHVENNEDMKKWLLDRYAASTFNQCKHQTLPMMSGPPICIHVDPNAQPSAVHTPAPIPLHWRDEVKQQLDNDVNLGVIEKVEPNTPTKWCHRAMWVRKADGSPRRVVDFQSLNRHCLRETHHTVPPFKQARSIPPDTYRSVTDAWNGYHSVPVRPCDRELLTFITEFGRYRYRVAPQGYLASGDGYTQRYDRIIADIPRKTKCVDDTVLWDENLEDHWWRIIDYLDLMGREGIILNPAKFQFACKNIEFAGFEITADDVRPLPKFLDAISCFPRPKKISDIRAWFGLVNQVSHYSKLTNIMAPFRSLLSPKTPFCWTKELDEAFSRSKCELIDAIKDGVRIFDPQRKTCLSPDWSRSGIGYWLRQKYCDCDSMTPDCCPDGWKVTLAGSRFLRTSELRYAPIEGEALAIAWSLEDTKFFTLGCDDLVISTDHKPLVKIFGDKSLDEISNSRIFRLKQRTLSWRFQIVHVPGTSIPASDAFSRNPVDSDPGSQEWLSNDSSDCVSAGHDGTWHMEASVVASTKASLDQIRVVSWNDVKNATICDPYLTQLKNYILAGFPVRSDCLPYQLQPYWRHRNDLSIVDDVIMFNDRIVIPPPLRPSVCQVLHSAHQGTNAMSQRARATVFWPGITSCIDRTRAQCDTCCRLAPSQPHLPPVDPFVPVYPFQAIAADYCSVAGNQYLVTVDRFSNWPEIFRVKPGSQTSGARGLQASLRAYFSTFGVVEELSSDGGPEFVAYDTQDFLRRWGVRHRLSSAYNPRSNGRAEVAVKSMKRLISDNVSEDGNILNDSFTRAMLQFRNCPDPENGISPAEIVFGRRLNDALPIKPQTQVFSNTKIRPLWRKLWQRRENTLRTRFAKQVESLQSRTKDLPPLQDGDTCRIQNQYGRFPLRWDRTGTIVHCSGNDQYLVKIDGSGRLSLRNRKYLRKVEPFCRSGLGFSPRTDSHQPTVPPPAIVPPVMPVTSNQTESSSRSDEDCNVDMESGPGDVSATPMTHKPPTPDVCRRSSRIKHPPVWHSDYVVGTVFISQSDE